MKAAKMQSGEIKVPKMQKSCNTVEKNVQFQK